MTKGVDGGRDNRVVLEHVIAEYEKLYAELTNKYLIPRGTVTLGTVCFRAARVKDMDYETLMVISRSGPSFAYHPTKTWVQCIGDPDSGRRVSRATGFGGLEVKVENLQEYWNIIKEKVDSNVPLQSTYFYDVLFIGYEEAREDTAHRARVLGQVGIAPSRWWSWKELSDYSTEMSGGQLMFLEEGKVKTPARDADIDVLKAIVMMAKADPRAALTYGPWEVKDVVFGLGGIEKFAADLADVSGHKGSYFDAMYRQGCATYPQSSGRASCAAYLSELARNRLFDRGLNPKLAGAAKEYEQAYAAWGDYEEVLCPRDRFIFPSEENIRQGKYPSWDFSAWDDPRRRREGASAVQRAFEHEQAVVGHIEAAMALIGSGS